ncbi:MAG: hydroxyacid dehydrogenase [Desulfobacteraceae bacterium]|nr:MAG: hydroxyacid dehydrogenase [Desulfobacteraceae bacterium]
MRILLASSILHETIDQIKSTHEIVCAFNAGKEQLKSSIKECEAVIFRSGVEISAEVMSCTSRLKVLIRAGSGCDNVDLNYVARHGLDFYRIPEPGASAVAEMSFCLMLGLARNLLVADSRLRQGHWLKHTLEGHSLTGKTLGIVGVGSIGSKVGRMGHFFGMDVIGCVKNISPSRISAQWRENKIRLTSFEEVVSSSDFISIHVPLDEGTRHLFDEKVFADMKPGAFLINLSRGHVVDEEALYKALTVKATLSGAGLDVHEKEGEGQISRLAHLSNVILTPHIGAQTLDSQKQIGRRIVEILESHSRVSPAADEERRSSRTKAIFDDSSPIPQAG